MVDMKIVSVIYNCIVYSGGRFEGTWHLNKKDGDGVYHLPNGQIIEGRYSEDKMVLPFLHGKMADNEEGVVSAHRPKTPLGSLIGKSDDVSVQLRIILITINNFC